MSLITAEEHSDVFKALQEADDRAKGLLEPADYVTWKKYQDALDSEMSPFSALDYSISENAKVFLLGVRPDNMALPGDTFKKILEKAKCSFLILE